jgi:hypothetical protein
MIRRPRSNLPHLRICTPESRDTMAFVNAHARTMIFLS